MITKALKQHAAWSSLVARPIAMFNTSSFKFPKHKELFAEDYYDDDQQENNPYKGAPFPGGQDFNDHAKGSHRSTSTGILATYKK